MPGYRRAAPGGARRFCVLGAVVILSAACARAPIVDTAQPGFDSVAYQQDLAVCQHFADQVDPGERVVTSTLVGAAAGAALGAIAGAFGGDAGLGAAVGAATGGAGGAISGGSDSTRTADQVMRNCLNERGYVILD